MHAARRGRGFTLIELLVVLAIAALLVAMTPVAFDRMRDAARYREAVRTILADLRQARSQALAEGVAVRYELDLSTRLYGVDGQPKRAIPEGIAVRATVARSEMVANRAAILFTPQGGATGGSFDVQRASGAGSRLRVDWLSGRITQEPLVP